MRYLDDALADAPALRTRAGAQRRLDRASALDFLGFVYERNAARAARTPFCSDARFTPVAFLNPDNLWMARELADAGIFVTNG